MTLGRNFDRKPATIEDSLKHAATPWDWRDSERLSVSIRDSERHSATAWNWKRQ